MQDIPLFTTDFGVAALTLSEVPYKGEAYVKIFDATDPREFLSECRQFCKAVGAEHIYASGHMVLTEYPFHTAIWKMHCLRKKLGETDAALFPVQQENMERWREVYNTYMRNVPNAATMSSAKMEELLQKGNAYFVYQDRQLLGIGIASGKSIDGIVSLIKGAGKTVLLALNRALSGEYAEVEVASENVPAVRLYDRLGFIKIEEISKWYKIA